MELIKKIISSNMYDIKCPYAMVAEGIAIHNTANDASAENEIKYMQSNRNEVSFHIAVDDVCAIQGLPLDRNAWHTGDGGSGKGNRKYIGIEICYSRSGGERFDKAERNCAELVAQMLKERGWGIDKVKKHQDFSGKYCPHRTIDKGWQRFLNMIQLELNTLNKPTSPVNSEIYRIRKTWADEKSQIGAFKDLENAKKSCKEGYSVFDSKGNKVYTVDVPKITPKPTTTVSNKKYLNLKPHVKSWRVYKTNVVARVGNECGFLAPANYGGLSYLILEDKGDVKIINTQSYGRVQIYAPRDNDSTITNSPIY